MYVTRCPYTWIVPHGVHMQCITQWELIVLLVGTNTTFLVMVDPVHCIDLMLTPSISPLLHTHHVHDVIACRVVLHHYMVILWSTTWCTHHAHDVVMWYSPLLASSGMWCWSWIRWYIIMMLLIITTKRWYQLLAIWSNEEVIALHIHGDTSCIQGMYMMYTHGTQMVQGLVPCSDTICSSYGYQILRSQDLSSTGHFGPLQKWHQKWKGVTLGVTKSVVFDTHHLADHGEVVYSERPFNSDISSLVVSPPFYPSEKGLKRG